MASTNMIVDAGSHGSMAGKRITAGMTNGAFTDFTTGQDFMACDTVTASGVVSGDSERLVLDDVSFDDCGFIGIDMFLRADADVNPWSIEPTGLGSPYGVSFSNWDTTSLTIDCWDGVFDGNWEDVYRASSGFLGGLSIVNGAAGVPSRVVAVNAGPILVDGGYGVCNLPVEMGMRGSMRVTQVDGVDVTVATNPVVLTVP